MPKYSTTAKECAPFAKRVAKPVMIGEREVTVYLNKGENAKGWVAYGGASELAFKGYGKTIDAAVDALIIEMTTPDPVSCEADTDCADTSCVNVHSVPQGEGTTQEESAPESTPVKMSGSEAAAHIAKAVKDARSAYGEYVRGERSVTSANEAAMNACTVVTELVQNLPEGEQRTRLYRYGTALAEHYYGKTGGGDSILTDAQRSRAGKKLGKIVAELAA